MAARSWIVCFLLVAVCAPASGQLAEDYRFKGRILDSKGNPVAKVRIVLYDVESGRRITFATKKDGAFDRRMIPQGLYDATFTKEGFATLKERFDWSKSSRETITKESRIVLETEEEKADRELEQNAAVLFKKTTESMAAGDWDQAFETSTELVSLGSSRYELAARALLARTQMARGKNDAAIEEFKRVLAMKPGFFDALYDLATLYAANNDNDAALETFKKALAQKPDDGDVCYSIGAILVNTKRFDEAIPYLKKVVEGNPGYSLAHKALGFATLQCETPDLAAGKAYLEKYLELEPAAADEEQIRKILAGIH